MDKYNVYQDIGKRTGGDLFFGVVGPVRTGKSTFIKRFMELVVLPEMDDPDEKQRTRDELPQSASGRLVMTTEPKFVPKQAAKIQFPNKETGRIRLIDCVGFMVPGAVGSLDLEERMVRTPWSEEEMEFSKAAAIGTRKVIHDHANIGIVLTTDGTFGELKRKDYEEAEARIVEECEMAGKPFVILLNTARPGAPETKALCTELKERYKKNVVAMNIKNMNRSDADNLMEEILYDFPITKIYIETPKWFDFLECDHWMKSDLIEKVRRVLKGLSKIGEIRENILKLDAPYIKEVIVKEKQLENGFVSLLITMEDKYYYEILSDLAQADIKGEYDLNSMLRDLSANRQQFEAIGTACKQVKGAGYAVMPPSEEEITIQEPELIRHGNKYGVKIRAVCPSLHFIQADIETEIAPIVGSEEQAKDLIRYIQEQSQMNPDGIFDTNIFGKTIRQLVEEGIQSKVNRLNEESQIKLQETIQKVVNDSNGGLVCIII